MLKINVYGKLDGSCGLCEAAKSKLRLMEVPFQCLELEDAIKPHDGWREDETVEVMACYSDIDTYPVITINGKAMSYPEAMKKLKQLAPSKPSVKAEPVFSFVPAQVLESELVMA